MTSIAIINKDKCKPSRCASECKKACPVNRIGKQCIEIEEIAKINESLCIAKTTNCNICVKKCPFGAINIVKIPSEIKNNLVHCYGENLFRLYKLPEPKLGKIIGILGQNGCGKSTIMHILCKLIIPNFNDMGNEIQPHDVIKNIRGTELQKYMCNLYENKLTHKLKPQDIMTIVKSTKNKERTIKELLEKYVSHEKYNEIIEYLELNKIYDNNLSTISGGELQKLIITVSLLAESNVYIFDEPTNYLDIEFRIKIANLIKELSNEHNYIFVVDHDLSILDFVSDYIHLMYGEPGAYGVVGTLSPAYEAINNFFEGYIPADNIKFRSEPYKLVESQIEEEQYGNKLYNIQLYEGTELLFDNFSLNIKECVISPETNMIVILGKNGTGKSTFLKYLEKNVSNVSYKHQINNALFDNDKYTNICVKDLLFNEIQSAMISGMFVSDVINLLSINKIYDKQVRKLSGGELQRVSIALCLGKPADIYLLDEPSASLDVEQRFNTTKVLKRFLLHNRKLGFIVEHDILMTMSFGKEYGSKIMVFEEQSIDNKRCSQNSELLDFKTGINKFLKIINTTFRTDGVNKRPRINKLNSTKDYEQKQNNKYYT